MFGERATGEFQHIAQKAFVFLESYGFRVEHADLGLREYATDKVVVKVGYNEYDGHSLSFWLIGDASFATFSVYDALEMLGIRRNKQDGWKLDVEQLVGQLSEVMRVHLQPALSADAEFYRRLADFTRQRAGAGRAPTSPSP